MKKIELEKCIGVWLDHEKAYFIKPGQKEPETEKMLSNIDNHPRVPGESSSGTRIGMNRSSNDEYSKHTKKQEQLKNYYKTLSNKLKSYDHVFLFGPSTAKNELGNFIRENKEFQHKWVEIKNAEELTENQMEAKVIEYFKEKGS